MKSAMLCCLVVLSLGLSAAPVPVAADFSIRSVLAVLAHRPVSVAGSKV